MTPKDKANELIDTFRMNVLDYEGCSINTHKAIQCALIVVDEIFKTGYLEGTTLSINKKYWQEVKQEIIGGEQ